jgi:hypothetical protein
LGGEFSPFCKNILKKNILSQIPCFLKNNSTKIIQTSIAYYMKRCLRLLYFHILNRYCQLWLNIFMDDCHLSNVTKLKKNHWLDQAGFGLSWRLACTSCSGKQAQWTSTHQCTMKDEWWVVKKQFSVGFQFPSQPWWSSQLLFFLPTY